MEQAVLVLVSLLLIATAVWSGSQIVTVFVNEGVSPAPQRATWWLRGALFPITGIAGWIVSTFMVDPYSWWLFVVFCAFMVWAALSTLLCYRMWQSHPTAVWKRTSWSIAIYAAVAAVIALPFRGFGASGLLIAVAIGYRLLPWSIELVLDLTTGSINDHRVSFGVTMLYCGFVAWLTLLTVGAVYHSLVKTEAGKMVQRATALTPTRVAVNLPKEVMGLGMFVWAIDNCEGGDLDKITAQAEWAGLDYIIVKTGDPQILSTGGRMTLSNRADDQRVNYPAVRELVRRFHQKGMRVYAWLGIFCDQPRKEIQLGVEAYELGVDGVILDAEDWCKGRLDGGEQLGRELRAIRDQRFSGKLLGFSSHDYPSYHPLSPYVQLDRYCDVFLPQMYWKDNWNVSYGDRVGQTPTERVVDAGKDELDYYSGKLKPAGGGRSFDWVIPVGQTYDHRKNPTVATTKYEECLEFVQATKKYWGCCFWDWDSAGSAQWEALRDSEGGRRADKVQRYRSTQRR